MIEQLLARQMHPQMNMEYLNSRLLLILPIGIPMLCLITLCTQLDILSSRTRSNALGEEAIDSLDYLERTHCAGSLPSLACCFLIDLCE